MSWSYRAPSLHPAIFIRGLTAAALQPGSNHVLWYDKNFSDAQAMAEKFRWFKWCVKQKPDAASNLFKILEQYEVRTQVKEDPGGWILYLKCAPRKVSEFERLNPELARDINV